MNSLDFYAGKKVLVTGHTGFKGSWLCQTLLLAGAEVIGYALEAPTNPALFHMLKLPSNMKSYVGDIRDLSSLEKIFIDEKPEIVIHLAAQSIVRASYQNPVHTYETNIMGTVNLLECIRKAGSVRSVVNITTDKVYENKEWCWGYRETDTLDGYEPYSNSKSCSELVTQSYKRSFLDSNQTAVSTARAGNVIGGGDFAANRIVPDCVRAVLAGEKIQIRNADSIRPYQHVMESLRAYLMIAWAQIKDPAMAGSYNVGPDESDCLKTGRIVELFCECWGDSAEFIIQQENGPHESGLLKLDCSKIKQQIGWNTTWDIKQAVRRTVEWAKEYQRGSNIADYTTGQIKDFMKEAWL